MEVLPHWRRGTAAVLCVSGPHAIPVSTAVRSGDLRIRLALGGRRRTLTLIRDDPRAALCVLDQGLAFTAHGTARELERSLASAPGVALVELYVESVQDHLADGRTELLGGVRWRWRERRWEEVDRRLVDELEQMADR